MAQRAGDSPPASDLKRLELAATLGFASADSRPEVAAAAKTAALAPRRVGHFVLLRTLGAGGMGTVYAAFDDRFDRSVAIKLSLQTPPPIDLQHGRTEFKK